MGWKRFNDRLGLIITVGLPMFWALNAKFFDMPEMVIGATVTGWTLVVQYYFRKKTPD